VLLWIALALLYPAFRGTVINFKVTYNPTGILPAGGELNPLNSTSSPAGITVMHVTRSLWGPGASIVGWCFHNDKGYIAYSLLLFGLVFPIIKAIIFHIWLLSGADSSFSRRAEKFMHTWSSLSRWAAVDACAESLFAGILMQSPITQVELLEGYACFVVYCIFSATAFALVSPNTQQPTKPMQSELGRGLSRVPHLFIVTMIAFVALLGLGFYLPSVHFEITEMQVMHEAEKVVPKYLLNIIGKDIGEHVKVDVTASLWECLLSVLQSDATYLAYLTQYCTALLFLCVVIAPSADVLLGTIGVFVAIRSKGEKDATSITSVIQIESARNIVQQFAMIDVMTVGAKVGTKLISGPTYECDWNNYCLYIMAAVVVWYGHSMMCSAVTATVLSSTPGEETKLVDHTVRLPF